MDDCTSQHDQPAASAETAGPESRVPAFRLSFVIPEFRFNFRDETQKMQVRQVMAEAMKELNLSKTVRPLAFRVHVQYSTEGLTEGQLENVRTGHKHPPCFPSKVASIFTSAADGTVVHGRHCIHQFLSTAAWGETDAVQVSIWEIDFGRREGVQ